MSIGSTIKKLRHEHDMTQEQLAELLNMTSAAISAWECDRNSPDISQIPLLSRIFGVSADVLLEIDLFGQEEKIENIIEKAEKLCGKEKVELYRLGLAEFPASYRLMLHLADSLSFDREPETYNNRLKERIALLEKIREGTKDQHLKNLADWRLFCLYLGQEKRNEAMKIAESVPHFMYSHNDFEQRLAQGKEKIYNLHYNIQGNFASLCNDIFFITTIEEDGKPFFTHEQAITILEKIPKFHEVFYENKDYLGDASMLSLAYTHMAEHYAELHDTDNTIHCFERALENAKITDNYYEGLENGPYGINKVWDYPQIPKGKRHTSLLANPDFDYPTTTAWIDKNGESHVQHCLKDFYHPRFDFVRDKIKHH